MKTSKYFTIFALIILFLLFIFVFSSTVLSLGVTPGRTNIDFSKNAEREVSFSVVNTENKNMNVAFTVEGELLQYISISKEVVPFTSEETSKDFTYKIKLPGSLEPGLHKAEIIITELPEDINDPGMLVKATVSVATQVYVYVPYPGKYIESVLDIVNKEDSNEINFYIPLVSRGSEKINSVKGTIDIYKGEEKITTINTSEQSISPGERKELSGIWIPDVSPGEYKAVVSINYDGEIKAIEKIFNVGNESLGLMGISVNNFKLGDVAKIKILVQNKLSDKIDNAFAGLTVYDSDMQKIADIKSENYEIPALSNKELVVYWDTENLEKGEYGSELKIDYVKKFIAKNFRVSVTEDSMSFTGVGFAIAPEGSSGKTSVNTILFIVIGLLILINLAWFIWWMRSRKKSK